MKKIGFSLFALALSSSFIHAGQEYNYNNSKGNSNQKVDLGIMYPQNNVTAKSNPQLQKNRFEINIDQSIVNEISQKRTEYIRAINQTQDMIMSNQPIYKPFSAIDNIYVTTSYSTVLMFPRKYKVTKATSAASMMELNHSENTVTFRPTKEFIEGNIVVGLTSKQGNRICVINVMKYSRTALDAKKALNQFDDGADQLSTIIAYIDKPVASNINILNAYLRLNAENCYSTFANDGDFDVFTYKNIAYYVIRDDKFGEIEIDGINYRISTNYTSFGDRGQSNDIPESIEEIPFEQMK